MITNSKAVCTRHTLNSSSKRNILSQAPFGRASGPASRAAPGEALPNICFVTGFTCEVGPEAIDGLHSQGEAMKLWLHAAYTSI